MAKNTPAASAADDFEDLLGDDADTPATPAAPATPDVESFDDIAAEVEAEAELTPEQLRIKELEDQLAQLDEPEVELTPDQKRIRELEALLEEKTASKLTETEFVTERAEGTGEKILFHFKKDGLLVLGNIWHRGQEVEIEVGSPAYRRTFNSRGESWLDLLDDENGQYAKWGDHFIGRGPFRPRPGEVFEDDLVKEDAKRRRRPISLTS